MPSDNLQAGIDELMGRAIERTAISMVKTAIEVVNLSDDKADAVNELTKWLVEMEQNYAG